MRCKCDFMLDVDISGRPCVIVRQKHQEDRLADFHRKTNCRTLNVTGFLDSLASFSIVFYATSVLRVSLPGTGWR